MGAAIAARLLETGEEVVVWNRSRDRAATSGLPIADTLRALAGQAEVIVSMLFDATALQEVYLGPDGLITAASGRLFIDMSTVRPGTQQTLGEQVRQAGGAFIECPVGGTIDPARSAAGARRRRGSRPGAPPRYSTSCAARSSTWGPWARAPRPSLRSTCRWWCSGRASERPWRLSATCARTRAGWFSFSPRQQAARMF